MQVVEVKRFGGPEVLDLIEEPTPIPKPGEVVIEVKASGINFADIMAREGHYFMVPSAPFHPGMEVAGVVTELGEGVINLQPGARVMGFIHDSGYATQAILDAKTAIPLPDSLGFAEATALLVQGLTALFLLEAAHFQPGQSVLISSAAGGVGSLAVQIARLKGAGKIIGMASANKHDIVRSHGAHEVVDYTKPGWSKGVLEATHELGVNVFLDSQGDPTTEAFDALADKAHWVVFGGQGHTGSGLPPDRLFAMLGKNMTLRGFSLYGSAPDFPRGMGELLGWAGGGKLNLEVHKFPLSEVAQAHEAISNRKTTGKVVLEP